MENFTNDKLSTQQDNSKASTKVQTPTPQQPTEATPEQPLEPTPSQKTSKNWLVPALVVVVALSLGIAGFFAYQNFQLKKEQPSLAQPTPTLTPTSVPNTNLKTYTDKQYGYSLSYPQNWQLETQADLGQSLTGIAEGHKISIRVWRVTGFGYCYKYSDRQEITVGGKTAETSDGIGGTEMCEEDMTNRGNTFVLIPLDDNDTRPTNQIHISYDYPLSDLSLAKANLNQVLSTFKFTDQAESTAKWKSYPGGQFPVKFNYPNSWIHHQNADNSITKLPYVRGFSDKNNTFISSYGCAMHLGFGGSQGPTQDLTNEDIKIDGRSFTKRVWYEEGKPIFISYLPHEYFSGFELLFVWLPTNDEQKCELEVADILSTFKFTN